MVPPPATTEYQRASSAVAMAFRGGRSVLSLRHNQVASIDHHHSDNEDDVIQQQAHVDLFHSHLADHLSSLAKLDAPLSFSFLHNLLRSFLSCESHFRSLLLSVSSKFPPPITATIYTDKPLSDLIDRFLKSLDMLNDLTAAIHSAHHWNRHADIAASALTTAAGEAQLLRAERALTKLLSAYSSGTHNPNPNPNPNPTQSEGRMTERAWSFLSRNNSTCSSNYTCTKEEKVMRVSRTWSAAAKQQLSAMSASLVAPRVGCYEGVALAAYTMSWLVVFVMRVLVAAFSGAGFVAGPVGLPKQVLWGAAMAELEEKVGEEWRRRRKGRSLKEMVEVDKCGKGVMEAVAKGWGEQEVVERAAELGEAGRRLEEGLGELEREVRVVFHRIVSCREEVIRWLETSRSAAAAAAAAAAVPVIVS